MLFIMGWTVGWVVAGVLAYGVTFAYFQRRYPLSAESDYKKDRTFAFMVGVAGYIGLGVAFFNSNFARYGLKWR